jgi:hypothetical protein
MGLMVNDFLQKAMPPPECCINADADFVRGLLDGQAAPGRPVTLLRKPNCAAKALSWPA